MLLLSGHKQYRVASEPTLLLNPLYFDIADRAEFRCEYCHAPQLAFNFAFEVLGTAFAFDPEVCHLIGITVIERVTIVRLKMNSSFQVRARQHWIQLELYP